jgi:hypothetical protein
MWTKPSIEVGRNGDGDIVIREVDERLLGEQTNSVVVQLQDVPGLVDALKRAIDGAQRDPEDSTTSRNLRPVGSLDD